VSPTLVSCVSLSEVDRRLEFVRESIIWIVSRKKTYNLPQIPAFVASIKILGPVL
jgi:hypothetical protein